MLEETPPELALAARARRLPGLRATGRLRPFRTDLFDAHARPSPENYSSGEKNRGL